MISLNDIYHLSVKKPVLTHPSCQPSAWKEPRIIILGNPSMPRFWSLEASPELGCSIEHSPGFPSGSVVKNLPASAGDTGDVGSSPESERSHGEGKGNPLQYSCLEYLMDSGTWWATVCGVTKCQTLLSNGGCMYRMFYTDAACDKFDPKNKANIALYIFLLQGRQWLHFSCPHI